MTISDLFNRPLRSLGVLLITLLCALPPTLFPAPAYPAEATDTLATLASFASLRDSLLQDIKTQKALLGAAASEAEKEHLRKQLEKLDADLRAVDRNFENVASGIDISSLQAQEKEEFNLQRELMGLLKPAIDEMKDMTAQMRQKSDLKEKIAYYEARLPVAQQALANADRLLAGSGDKVVNERLKATADSWRKQRDLMQSELRAAQLELDKLTAGETSLAQASENYLKAFFQKRGLYLTEALLVVLGVLLLSRMTRAGLQRYVPGFRKPHRSFRIRLIALVHRAVTILLVILGPMIVFYLVEDWVLFSLGILVLLGLGLALRQAVPRYWHQVQIYLNIGSVREGERILMDDLPWMVQQINVFTTLVNPVAELSQRVPINELVGLKSRPARPDEPWYPCRRGDWVILRDGVRGKVVGISPEMVQLVERGGAMLTYRTADFLANSPRNLATNFRLKETLGISYGLQKESTTRIPAQLQEYVQRRVDEEGYADKLVNLRVEFAQANTSSLDLVVIADFRGELGDLYNRLRRAIQRWCVDACTEYGWEIPFPQLTVHSAVAARE